MAGNIKIQTAKKPPTMKTTIPPSQSNGSGIEIIPDDDDDSQFLIPSVVHSNMALIIDNMKNARPERYPHFTKLSAVHIDGDSHENSSSQRGQSNEP